MSGSKKGAGRVHTAEVAGRAAGAGVRQQARDAARASILRAARQLFAEKGFAAASLVGIAELAGFTKGLVHHYFGSKRELWIEVIDDYARQGMEREQAFGEGRADLDSIVARLRGTFRFFQRNREYLRIATWAELEAERGLPPSLEKLMHQHTDLLQRAQRAGGVRADVDPVLAHVMTYCLVTGWFQNKQFFCPAWGRNADDPAVDEAYLEDMLAFVRGGLAAVAAHRSGDAGKQRNPKSRR